MKINRIALLFCVCSIAMTGLWTEPAHGAEPATKEAIVMKSAILKVMDETQIPSEFEGTLAEVKVKPGVMVKKDQVLAVLNHKQLSLKLVQAQLELERVEVEVRNDFDVLYAEKSLAVAKSELERAYESRRIASQSVSEAEVERLKLLVDRAEVDLKRQKRNSQVAKLTQKIKLNEIEQIKEQIARHQIKTPIDGMVVSVDTNLGEWVMPSNPIAKLVRVDRLRVEGFVTADQAAQDLMGREVRLQIKIPGSGETEFKGVVTFVHPDANPVNSQVRVWAEIDNSDFKLRPGLRGDVIISEKTQTSTPANNAATSSDAILN